MLRLQSISLLLALAVTAPGHARLIEAWTYQEMFDKADLVVIADATSTKDTEERSTLIGVPVIGVATEFKTSLVMKAPTTRQRSFCITTAR